MSRMALEVERLVREMRKTSGGLKPAGDRLADALKPKRGLTKKQEKAKKLRTQAQVVKDVREQVWLLDSACICGECPPRPTDEMHEIVPRSKTRGLPPEERFSVQNCVRLSRKHHAMVTGELGHGKRLKITPLDDVKGAMGPLLLEWKNGKSTVYERRDPALTSGPQTSARCQAPGEDFSSIPKAE